LASIGCEVSGEALWAKMLPESKHKNASAPQSSETRRPNRSDLRDTNPSSGSTNLLFSYYGINLSNEIVVSP
jgi:hypothetical protein